MLDMKRIRENPDLIRQGIANKNEKDTVGDILELDGKRRAIIQEVDALKNTRNVVSDEIAKLKKNKENADDKIAEMKVVSEKIKGMDSDLREIEEQMDELLLFVPNMVHESVPVGKTESDNKHIREWIPEGIIGLNAESDETLLDHVALGSKLGILDFERGAKLSGSGFPLYMGKGATLERALINFMLDLHLEKHGYKEVFPPFVVNTESMRGTGQLPKLGDDMYRCADDDLYLIPTAEVPITNIYRGETLGADELPMYMCGYSSCFRREAGSYGKETKGFLRVHEFNKVELVKYSMPENSYDELEKLVGNAEAVLQALNIPYRLVLLCTGDTSFASAKTYDLEIWAPGEKKWLEVSSCSNFEDFQARRANIRFKRDAKSKPEFIHTLNGSGLATSRLMISLLENNQTPEGKIVVPKPLQKYTGFSVIE
ncbi:MAG: serine--tRNA ligase [Ectothiorhodospiraceae bacterium]|nr:serine--tRNA ligase [Ectothiorhodospiraceae bacterium]